MNLSRMRLPREGLEEPVRGFPFFLLSRSFVEIGKEAEATYPKPDMDAFIAKLDVSPELKAWMKKHDWVMLAGEDFIRKLHPDDILDVPEFKTAYMDRNAGDQSADFPETTKDQSVGPEEKPRESSTSLPPTTSKQSGTISDSILRASTESTSSLASIDPSPRWNGILVTRITAIHSRTLDLAESTYLVARAETNLQGQGFMRGLAPGTYWLSTLDNPAIVGDARPRWDIPVVLRAGETKYITLSNSNSVRPQASQ